MKSDEQLIQFAKDKFRSGAILGSQAYKSDVCSGRYTKAGKGVYFGHNECSPLELSILFESRGMFYEIVIDRPWSELLHFDLAMNTKRVFDRFTYEQIVMIFSVDEL